jgi:flagellar biosynthesis chaperone FliJ
MHDKIGKAKSELAQAESVLREAEGQLREINAMLEERWLERRTLDSKIKSAASAGQVDNLMRFQIRSRELDKSIFELGQSGAKCLKRIEGAKKYLDTLNVRLENLKKEGEKLAARIERHTKSLTAPLKLSRVKIQIDAIKGNK